MPISQLSGSRTKNDDKSKTFVFDDEGHTLGNALRCIVSSYKDVEFCAYTVPHPAESKMHFRIQMREGKAVDALSRGLQDLVKMCDHTMVSFDKALDDYKN